jgi:uncharacterized protein (DUF1810 family)
MGRSAGGNRHGIPLQSQPFPDRPGLKFRSSMILFARAVPESALFYDATKKYFNDRPDPRALKLLP